MNKKLLSLVLFIGLVAAMFTMTGCFGSDDESGAATIGVGGVAVNTFLTQGDVSNFYAYIQDKSGKKQNIAQGVTFASDAATTGKFTARLLKGTDYNDRPVMFMFKYKLNNEDRIMMNVTSKIAEGQQMPFTPATTAASLNLMGVAAADLSAATNIDAVITSVVAKVETANLSTKTAAAITEAKAVVASRLGMTSLDSTLEASTSNAAIALKTAFSTVNLKNATVLGEIVNMADPTKTITLTNITNNLTSEAAATSKTIDTATITTNVTGTTTVNTATLYPSLQITAINGTAVTYGTISGTTYPLTSTSTPEFDLPKSATDVAPVYTVGLSTPDKAVNTSVTMVFYGTGTERATVELTSLQYSTTAGTWTIPADARVTITYKNAVRNTYTNRSANIFTASAGTLTLNLTSTMASAIFTNLNGQFTSGGTYSYMVVLNDALVSYGGNTYNTVTGSIKYVTRDLSSLSVYPPSLSLQLSAGTASLSSLVSAMAYFTTGSPMHSTVTPTWTKTSGVGTVSGTTYTFTTTGEAVLTASYTYGSTTKTATVSVTISSGPNPAASVVALPYDSTEIDVYYKSPATLNGGTSIILVRKEGSAPTAYNDGTYVTSEAVTANTWYKYYDTGRTGGTVYYYAAFIADSQIPVSNYSTAVSAAAKAQNVQTTNTAAQFYSTLSTGVAVSDRIYALDGTASATAVLCGKSTATTIDQVPLTTAYTRDTTNGIPGGTSGANITFYVNGRVATTSPQATFAASTVTPVATTFTLQ